MTTLTVKGPRNAALAAAEARGIPVLEVLNGTADPWTIIRTGDDAENVARVASWFVEPASSEPGEGFAAGVLLLYYW